MDQLHDAEAWHLAKICSSAAWVFVLSSVGWVYVARLQIKLQMVQLV